MTNVESAKDESGQEDFPQLLTAEEIDEQFNASETIKDDILPQEAVTATEEELDKIKVGNASSVETARYTGIDFSKGGSQVVGADTIDVSPVNPDGENLDHQALSVANANKMVESDPDLAALKTETPAEAKRRVADMNKKPRFET